MWRSGCELETLELSHTMVLAAGGRVVVGTGPGHDRVSVSTDPATGEVVIDVNGVKHFQPGGTEVTIRGGKGHDTVEVCQGTPVLIKMVGRTGDYPSTVEDAAFSVQVEVADVAGFIRLDGSPSFRQRILDDLRPRAELPRGQRGNSGCGNSGVGNELTIRERGPHPGEAVMLYHEFGRVYR